MSARRLVTLDCDTDGCLGALDTGEPTIPEARRLARETHGWARRGNNDSCAGCEGERMREALRREAETSEQERLTREAIAAVPEPVASLVRAAPGGGWLVDGRADKSISMYRAEDQCYICIEPDGSASDGAGVTVRLDALGPLLREVSHG